MKSVKLSKIVNVSPVQTLIWVPYRVVGWALHCSSLNQTVSQGYQMLLTMHRSMDQHARASMSVFAQCRW